MKTNLQISTTLSQTKIHFPSTKEKLPSTFWISSPGGLFHPGDDNQENAFRYSVDKINADKSILPRSKLTAQVEIISPQDSFHASKRGNVRFAFFRIRPEFHFTIFRHKVCHLLRMGVAAIFGPQSAHTASHVQSICDTMEVPHLETRWDYRLRRESCLVNLYPHPSTLSKVTNTRNFSIFFSKLNICMYPLILHFDYLAQQRLKQFFLWKWKVVIATK